MVGWMVENVDVWMRGGLYEVCCGFGRVLLKSGVRRGDDEVE